MTRVQLALNVRDLDQAVAFYSTLFQTGPAKRRAGYANFAVAEPPLKLVLFENSQEAGTLNHLGVEVDSTDEVADAARRLEAEGHPTEVQESVTCCHALQDKVWVSGADTRWEVYTVLADSPSGAAAPADAARCGEAAPGDESVCCAI
ncbi:MAG: ArsI/CadI family heavy metal resistance metalloenzyme [Candidatus Dormiibacterota bacterium]